MTVEIITCSGLTSIWSSKRSMISSAEGEPEATMELVMLSAMSWVRPTTMDSGAELMEGSLSALPPPIPPERLDDPPNPDDPPKLDEPPKLENPPMPEELPSRRTSWTTRPISAGTAGEPRLPGTPQARRASRSARRIARGCAVRRISVQRCRRLLRRPGVPALRRMGDPVGKRCTGPRCERSIRCLSPSLERQTRAL